MSLNHLCLADFQDYLKSFKSTTKDMLNWIKKNLFAVRELRALEKENEALKAKLEEKQEHINKTNAYWKKKMHEKRNNKF